MKKRLFLIIMLISVVSSVLSCVMTTVVYYSFYVEDAENKLKSIVELTKDFENWEDEGKINSSVNKILNATDYSMRFTIIRKNGEVVYDSRAKNESLESHKDRPEVAAAFEKGHGEDTRYSSTTKTDMYYYAVKISENEVLRVSRDIRSINSVFIGILPVLVLLFVFLLVIVYASANSFTRRVLKPVKEMTRSLDEMLEDGEVSGVEIYDEFESLSLKIREQKIKINQYIDELKHERDTIGLITENMKEGFILINKNRQILSINTSGKHMIGNDKFDLRPSRNILELIRNSEILQQVENSIEKNIHTIHDIKKDGRHLRYYFSPVKEQYSLKATGLLILIEDITNQKNAEIMRREFSANVSHELKTPLTTIIGFAEMIKEGLITDSDSIRKYCGMINNEGLRLIALIEDIMRLSRIEEGVRPEENSNINLKEIAEETAALLSPKAEELNIHLEVKVVDAFIKANRNYMSELMYNLVDNGIKYNKSGGFVYISVKKDGRQIIISVSDTGVGIPEEYQDRIFERFYRVDKSRSKETGGTGLGLSIVKHIAELYNGKIELKTKEDEGTEITVTFSCLQ